MAHTVSSSLSDRTLNRIMAIESRGKLKAKAPTSSALGLFQFLNGTWDATVKKHRPDLFEGRNTAQVRALRTDGTVCIELGARFTEDNARGLGPGYTDGDLYLAHFLGLGAAKKFLRAPANASAAALAGPDAVKANKSILAAPKTAGQVRAWAQHSMETRWDQCGNVDWVSQYYDPSSPLADASHKDHEIIDHEPPVKHEENFEPEEDEPDEPETTQPSRKQVPVDEREDDSSPSIVTTVKTAFKSKIVWLAGLLGFGGSGSAVSSDTSLQHTLMALVTKPAFLFAVVAIIAAGLIVYFYWRDHGKGAIR